MNDREAGLNWKSGLRRDAKFRERLLFKLYLSLAASILFNKTVCNKNTHNDKQKSCTTKYRTRPKVVWQRWRCLYSFTYDIISAAAAAAAAEVRRFRR